MKNVLVTDEAGTVNRLKFMFPLEYHCSLDTLPTEGAALVIIDTHLANWFELFVTLRNTTNYYLTPIFYFNEPATKFCKLFDGELDETTPGMAAAIQARLKLIDSAKLAYLDNEELRLMCYLFTRPNTFLEGYYDANSPFGYRYPHLELLFNQPKANFFPLLDKWVSQKLLTHAQWVDEIKLCPHCQSASLNFKDACPNCQSIKIKTQISIQCYGCGNLSPLTENMQQNGLVCSKCLTQMLHVGHDYEQALDDKICLACNSHFFNPATLAFCMMCLQSCAPEQLISKQLFHYQLSQHGENWLRGIEAKLNLPEDSVVTLSDFKTFITLLNWQLDLAIRYQPIHFSVLALKLTHEQTLSRKIINQLLKETKSLLRESDILTQQDDIVYFIFPMASKENTEIIIQRLQTFIQQQCETLAIDIQISFNSISSEAIIPLKLKGKQLLHALIKDL